MSASEQLFLKSIKRDDHGFVFCAICDKYDSLEKGVNQRSRDVTHTHKRVYLCVICLLLNKIWFRFMRVHICAAECA